MDKQLPQHICKSCGNIFHGNFCNICGQKVIKGRFTLRMFMNDILSIFNLERGLFYTIFQLIKDPGKVIKEYLGGKTKSYYNPLKLLILAVGVSVVIAILSDKVDESIRYTNEITKNYVDEPHEGNDLASKILPFVKNYLNVIMILMVPFISLGFKIVFYRRKLYYSEHLIINSYSFSITTFLSFIITGIFLFFNNLAFVQGIVGYLFMIVVYSYIYQGVTKKNAIITFFASLISIFIGMIFFMIFMMSVIFLAVLILKKIGIF